MVGSYAIGEEKEKAEKWRDEISEREGREREREREIEKERERVVWGRGSKVVKCDTFRPCSFGFGGSNPPLFLVLKTILFHY